ncbi:MAG: hypothetical protein ACTSVA_07050 [Candidatus Njordarchaeales archaeon]
MQIERINAKIGETGEEEYLRIFYPEAQYLFKYLEELRSVDNDRALKIIDAVSRERDLIKRIYNMYKGKVIVVDIEEDLKHHNIWLEWKTEGQVFSKVLGKKKSYKFTLRIPPIVVCDYEKCKQIDYENMYPTFEIFVDIIDIYVKKSDKHIRRFWNREGKITVYLVLENVRTLERKKYQIGEISVKWLPHEPVDRLARKRVHFLRNRIKELERRADLSMYLGEKLRIRSIIKKLKEKLNKELKKTYRQWQCGLVIRGKIGDIEIRKLLLKPKLPKPKKKRKRKLLDAVGIVAIKENEITSERWGIKVVGKEELKEILVNTKLKHVFTVNKRVSFYGKYGKMNHEVKVVSIPRRKIEVEILVQARERVWRKLVQVKKHPVRIYEYMSDNISGLFAEGKKIWVIEPVDNVARFEIINRDHAGEAMDRIMVHLERGQYLVFYHEL